MEVDFAAATGTKAQRIARSPKLHSALSPPRDPVLGEKPYCIEGGGTSLRSEHYSLLPLDLRTPDALTVLDDLLDPSLPTLILAECVLCYMQPQEADRIFTWAGRFADRAIIVYEMVGLKDTFGQVMRRNLAVRLFDSRSFTAMTRITATYTPVLTRDRSVISSCLEQYTIRRRIWLHASPGTSWAAAGTIAVAPRHCGRSEKMSYQRKNCSGKSGLHDRLTRLLGCARGNHIY